MSATALWGQSNSTAGAGIFHSLSSGHYTDAMGSSNGYNLVSHDICESCGVKLGGL